MVSLEKVVSCTGVGFLVEDDAVEQLVLPLQCRADVVRLAHRPPFAGQLGRDKTANRLLQRFYWPTLFADVAKAVKTCDECQRTAPKGKMRAPLVPLPVMTAPFRRIAMDIVGPLPRSRSGKRFVLVICDYATRFPEAIPMRSVDAVHVAEELLVFCSRFGVPQEILTNQGANFTSKLLTELYRMLHVHPIRTTPYHPQTDGLVERFNKTLKSMLRKAAISEGKDWDKMVPYLLFAYREVEQVSTGFSPFELVYGWPVRGPLDVLKEAWETKEDTEESVVSYILTIQERLHKMREMVADNLEKAQQEQKRWYDQKARSQELSTGDKVLVLLPTESKKLFARWQGPYKVVKKIGKVNYQVELTGIRKPKRIFHVNLLRPYHSSEFVGLVQEASDCADDDDIEVWGTTSSVKGVTLGSELTDDQRGQVRGLMSKFGAVWSDVPGRTDRVTHTVETGSAHPVRQPPYRIPHAYKSEVLAEVQSMQAAGVIEPSTSPWCFPIVPARKKDSTLRICVDYRKLNALSSCDAYPMPRIDDLIDRLGKACYITTLDLAKGYWQVPLASESRAKTTFSSPLGLFQFTVMPFGLQGAPATFQRLMDSVVSGLDFCAAYLDDLIVHSETWKEHLTHLEHVFVRLEQAGLTVKASKCQIGMKECVYLGHVVGNGQVRPEPSKLEAVDAFPTPKTKKQVRTFLGLSGYYRRFIQNYASLAAPLSDLTRKSLPKQVQWTDKCQIAFVKLKDCLCKAPVLNHPDFGRSFVLQTDASDHGIGAVLSQVDDADQEHPVAFYSRKFLAREERYATVEKECLAIKLGVQAFKMYLLAGSLWSRLTTMLSPGCTV